MSGLGCRDWMRESLDLLDGPAVAVELDRLRLVGDLPRGVAVEFVAEAWDLCPWPMSVLTRASWVALFGVAGYTRELVPAPRPRVALRLFRGSDPAGVEGLCWSESRDVARWMAGRFAVGVVWSAVVEPWRLLAYLDEGWEQQHVVDTTGLQVEVVDGPGVVAGLDREALVAGLDARMLGAGVGSW